MKIREENRVAYRREVSAVAHLPGQAMSEPRNAGWATSTDSHASLFLYSRLDESATIKIIAMHFRIRKSIFTVPVIALAACLVSLPLSAKDNDSAKERREQMKDVRKRATAKADKQFRKEAEKLEKQGWKPISAKSIARQLERQAMMEAEENDEYMPKFLFGTGNSIGQNIDAARMQATTMAKLDIVRQLESVITGELQTLMSNREDATATSGIETTGYIKEEIGKRLGRTIPVVDMYKVSGANKEVRIIVAYNFDTAVDLTKEVIRENMLDKAEKIGEKYNNQESDKE